MNKLYNGEEDFCFSYWVKKIGPVHRSTGKHKYATDCGKPMLGNNYAKYATEREYCPICFPYKKEK